MAQDTQLAAAFVDLASTLTTDFDVVEFLQVLTERSVSVLGLDAAGLVLTDPHGQLRFVSAAPERAPVVGLIHTQDLPGPCRDAVEASQRILCPDLRTERGQWPGFAAAAEQAGFCSVHVVPMRLRDHTIGALTLLSAEPRTLSETELKVAQAMADLAAVGLLHARAMHENQLLVEQLHTTLNDRDLIEQGKGVLAERRGIDPEQAFEAMRAYAPRHAMRLAALAHAIIANSPDIGDLADGHADPDAS